MPPPCGAAAPRPPPGVQAPVEVEPVVRQRAADGHQDEHQVHAPHGVDQAVSGASGQVVDTAARESLHRPGMALAAGDVEVAGVHRRQRVGRRADLMGAMAARAVGDAAVARRERQPVEAPAEVAHDRRGEPVPLGQLDRFVAAPAGLFRHSQRRNRRPGLGHGCRAVRPVTVDAGGRVRVPGGDGRRMGAHPVLVEGVPVAGRAGQRHPLPRNGRLGVSCPAHRMRPVATDARGEVGRRRPGQAPPVYAGGEVVEGIGMARAALLRDVGEMGTRGRIPARGHTMAAVAAYAGRRSLGARRERPAVRLRLQLLRGGSVTPAADQQLRRSVHGREVLAVTGPARELAVNAEAQVRGGASGPRHALENRPLLGDRRRCGQQTDGAKAAEPPSCVLQARS